MGQPEGSGTTACDWICISWFFHSFCIIFYRSPPSLSQLWKVQGGCLFSSGEGIILWRTTILLMLHCLPNCGNCFYFHTSIFWSPLCVFSIRLIAWISKKLIASLMAPFLHHFYGSPLDSPKFMVWSLERQKYHCWLHLWQYCSCSSCGPD